MTITHYPDHPAAITHYGADAGEPPAPVPRSWYVVGPGTPGPGEISYDPEDGAYGRFVLNFTDATGTTDKDFLWGLEFDKIEIGAWSGQVAYITEDADTITWQVNDNCDGIPGHPPTGTPSGLSVVRSLESPCGTPVAAVDLSKRIAQVKLDVDALPDPCAAVDDIIAAEKAGRNRAGLLRWLEGFAEGCNEPD